MKKEMTIDQFLPRWLLRVLHHRFDERFQWGSIGLHPKHWRIALEFHQPDIFYQPTIQLGLIWITFYIYLPHWLGSKKVDSGCRDGNQWGPSYGIYTIDTSLVFRWGSNVYKSWDIPFISFNHQSTEILSQDRKTLWIERSGQFRGLAWNSPECQSNEAMKDRAREEASDAYPYTYRLRSGEAQNRTATVHIERRTWGRKWAPWMKLVRTDLDIRFNEEVGEDTGSWKGGVVGTSHRILPGESRLECLRRFEATRKFGR